MASIGLWRARMLIAQRKCNQESNRSVFAMKSMPKTPSKIHSGSKQHNRRVKKISSIIDNRNGSELPEAMRIQNDEANSKTPMKDVESEPSSSFQQERGSDIARFGEGIIPDEELNRQRVRRHPNKKNNQWVTLLKKDLENHQHSVAEKRAAKISGQREFGNTLRKQIEHNTHKAAMEKKRRQEEAEQLARELKEKEKDEFQKREMQKQVITKNCMFIQEQLRIRREASERAEKNKHRLDLLAREALQRKLEKEKQLVDEARRRIREDLQHHRAENERHMKEKANMLAEERKRDIEEQQRNIAAMEAAELEKQNRVKKIADKTAALEKESEVMAKIMQQKQEEEERRIKKYQEECDEKEKMEELERKRRQKAIIEDMKNSIKLQLDERRRILLIQAEEAKKIALTARELAAQELKRLRNEDHKAEQRRRQYKAELERQIQLRDELSQTGFDGMNQNELAINRNLLN